MTTYINGIDVSNLQGGALNWSSIAASGVQWCGIRCGNGNDSIDQNYATNYANAIAAGLKVITYHAVFPLPTTAVQPLRDPVAQANYHFNNAQGQVAMMDFEWPTPVQWSKWGCSASQINAWGLAYLAEYSRLLGRPMIVYTYPDFAANVRLTSEYAQYPLWIASYTATPAIPAPWTDWTLWQHSDSSHLPSGMLVDTDYAKDLSLWDQAPTTPIAAPQPPSAIVPAPQPVPTPVPAPVVPAPVQAPASSSNFFTQIINALTDLFK